MQKPVNLLEIYNLYKEKELLSDSKIKEFLQIQNCKEHEIEALYILCEELKRFNDECFDVFEGYYINYTIPQIGKEFDLIRFENNRIINIELKSKEIKVNKILDQLKRNYYYFFPFKRKICCYTFIAAQRKLYQYLETEEKLEEIEISNLFQVLKDFEGEQKHLDILFAPINYLIFPFNNTQSFVDNKYFLTEHQEQICKDIETKIKQESHYVFSISGEAGTGKTLLTYHIAKNLREQNYKVIIVHCASSNSGICKLKELEWNIYTIKEFNKNEQIQADIIIIDEAQRISMDRLKRILEERGNKILIFSHDVHQKLNRTNEAEEVTQTIEEAAKETNHKLNNKIRHNKKIAYFITKIFNLNNEKYKDLKPESFNNIFLHYANNPQDAKKYIDFLVGKNWQYIYLSTDLYKKDKLDQVKFASNMSSHQAIGQEWDNIIVTITEDFYYTEQGKLSYKAKYFYNPSETLFQALTRVRKRLTLVIINNPDIYKKCVEILHES